MTAQTAARPTAIPQTPPLPQAKPESLGLSPARLQRMSDAFKREIDKGTVPGVTVLVARRGQIGWFEALGRQAPAASAPMSCSLTRRTPASSRRRSPVPVCRPR